MVRITVGRLELAAAQSLTMVQATVAHIAQDASHPKVTI